MNATEQIKTDWIRRFATAAGPCITLAIANTPRANTANEVKAAIRTIRQELEGRTPDVEALLAPVIDAAGKVSGGTGGTVILRSPELMETHRVPAARNVARVDDRFDIATLLSLASARDVFYLLALSQNRTRILKYTGDECEEVPYPDGIPASFTEAVQPGESRDKADSHLSAGQMGTGSSSSGSPADRDHKGEYLYNFFTDVAKAVNLALKDADAPLIAVGVEREIALYARVNTYPNLVEGGIHGAPDGLDTAELHKRALQLLDERSREPGRLVPADFDKRVGTGHASTHIPEIVSAAFNGRVSHLFFQEGAEYAGTFDAVRQRVKHNGEGGANLVEDAAWQTILQGGEVRILPGSAMPNGVKVCALFRYPQA